jgi:ATP-dependent DNA ligase I
VAGATPNAAPFPVPRLAVPHATPFPVPSRRRIVGASGDNDLVRLIDIARTSDAVRGASARRAKRDLLAECLRRAAAGTRGEVAIAVAYLSGELPQRQIGVGYAALRERPPPAADASLSVAETDAAFTAIGRLSGPGSVRERRRLVSDLLARATAAEQSFVIRLLSGELRQGALDGVMADAIAAAAGIPAAEVRRALMLSGSLGGVAEAALGAGGDADRAIAALREFGLEVGRPGKPMLAQSAETPEAALRRSAGEAPAAVEWKIDGVRVQAHVDGTDVRLFTRTLDDISARVPEVVSALRELPVRTAVLDGELIALRPDGRPHPFQVTAARAARRQDVGQVPLTAFLFDLLHLDGTDLIDRPGAERYDALAAAVPERLRIPRIVTADAAEATAFFQAALAHGHEGVMVKSLGTPYTAGRRGAGWVKAKPRHTLDLVVLAAEWGHGRRRGRLSNLHLGARDPGTGGFVMLGKTFKGLTDEMLAWQTERLLALADRRDDWVVRTRPELVVEIAFDGVQRSSRYPGGLALRFARVLRHRPDKPADEADTFDTVREIGAALGFAADESPEASEPAEPADGAEPDAADGR